MRGDHETVVSEAAKHVDLLNNILRWGGYHQQRELLCLCTEEQKKLYEDTKPEGEELERTRMTRHWTPGQRSRIRKERPLLDATNPRLGIDRQHPHVMGRGDIITGVVCYRKYIRNVLLHIGANPNGKKALLLAWWLVHLPATHKEKKALQTVFGLGVEDLNRILEQETARLGRKVWDFGSISRSVKRVGPLVAGALDRLASFQNLASNPSGLASAATSQH